MNATKTHGAVLAGLAYAQLEVLAGAEFIHLSSPDQSAIACNLLDASHADKCSTREYLGRIGKGNLAKYAKHLMI